MSGPNRGLPERKRMRHDRHFVDELTRRMGEGIGRLLAVDAIVPSEDQPRTEIGNLADLVASITNHGVLEPLLVRPRSDGRFELISGQRRLAAALSVGLTEVPCVELLVTDQAAMEIALIENLQREDLSPFDEAEGFRTLIAKYGYTHEQVADAVGRSRVTVTETLRLLTIPAEVRAECRHADIAAKGLLLELAKAESEEEMRTLLHAIVEHRLDRDALRRLRQELASTGEPAADQEGAGPTRRARPLIFRYRHPDQRFSFALTFRADTQPDPTEVIAALEELIRELREDAEGELSAEPEA